MTGGRNNASPEDGLQPQNFAKLNADFYETRPWVFFSQRLAHLALATDSDRYREVFSETYTIGKIKLTTAIADSDAVPTVQQQFVAIEAESLLHHAGEALLRFVHAHATDDECPWLQLSRTPPRQFRQWVRTAVTRSTVADRKALCVKVLTIDADAPEEIEFAAEYLRLYASHFLDSAPYNAAKHGLAIQGGSERWTLSVEGAEVLDRDGTTLEWLAAWRPDKETPLRWTRSRRAFSLETVAVLIHLATQLMQCVWLRARERYLDQPADEVYRPVSPDELFAGLDVRHPVLAEWFVPLAYEGAESRVYIRSRHFGMTDEPYQA